MRATLVIIEWLFMFTFFFLCIIVIIKSQKTDDKKNDKNEKI